MSEERIITYRGVKLHPGQARILKHIQHNPQAKYICIKTSRQWGKSLFGMQLVLNHAINEKKIKIGWFSPYIAQAKKVMKQLYEAIAPTGIVFDYNQTDRIITLCTGSKIQFWGVENCDAIRGETLDYVICDECAFFKPDVFEYVIRPLLKVRGKRCYLISTPRGKKNWFYKYYTQTDKLYTSCEGNYQENIYASEEETEAARLLLPEHIFRQEYLGEFLDSEFLVFPNLQPTSLIDNWGAPTAVNYAGLDLGRKQDYTVLYIINDRGETVDIYRDNNKLWQTLLNQAITRLRKYNAHVVVDATGVGDPVFEQLKTQYKHCTPFVISGFGDNSKQGLIEQLIISMQNDQLKIPSKTLYGELHEEMNAFECIYTPQSRTIKYQAMQGFHDDIILAMALCDECRIKKLKVGGSYNIRAI
jgi:phage terminase large subunit